MVFGDRNCEEFTFPSRLQRMDQTERQRIVTIIPHISVENQGDSVSSQRPRGGLVHESDYGKCGAKPQKEQSIHSSLIYILEWETETMC